jgi:charged multivesicular body protein 5
VDSVEVKIKRLDAELFKYREQMARMRDGPAKVRQYYYDCIHVMIYTCQTILAVECRKAKGHKDSTAEKDVQYSTVECRIIKILLSKNRYEGHKDQMMQQSFNMEQTQFVTENLKNTITTVEAMKVGAKEMKQQYKKLNIDKIDVCLRIISAFISNQS